MEYRFSNRQLENLYTTGSNPKNYPPEVVKKFALRVRHIEAAKDERDLRHPPSVHFKALKGDLAGKCSLRLNKQWRLIISIETKDNSKTVVIEEISKHYE